MQLPWFTVITVHLILMHGLDYLKNFQEMFGMDIDMNDIYGKLYNNAMTGDKDCGGLLAFNLFSGEPVIGLNEEDLCLPESRMQR